MGKASRRKRERRESGYAPSTTREALRRTQKVDRRGSRVPPTVEAYERLCASPNRDRLAEALIARHNLRMLSVATRSSEEVIQVLKGLTPIPLIDHALIRYGANVKRPPAQHRGEWIDHLLWAVDGAVSATRLLLCGQHVGACAVARLQLERWTLHRAFNANITRGPDESLADFVARVWSVDESFHGDWRVATSVPPMFERTGDGVPVSDPTDHRHVTTTDGREICPSEVYMNLSELLHGRVPQGPLTWDGDGLIVGDEWTPDSAVVVDLVTSAITLCLRQVRAAIAELARGRRDIQTVISMRGLSDSFSRSDSAPINRPEVVQATLRDFGFDAEGGANTTETPPPGARESQNPPRSTRSAMTPSLPMLAPLTPREGLAWGSPVHAAAQTFIAGLSGRPFGRLFYDDEFTTLAFAWHRSRSINAATWALQAEKAMIGEEFNLEVMSARATRWILLSEMATLAGAWAAQRETSSAMAVVASGLRSANWLWLEDDDRAMAVLKAVFEQTARLRTWRLKPEKARDLEAQPSTTPRDWLEAAGWRRLGALAKALGEFAHTTPNSKWSGARELLARLQMNVNDDRALFTARGSTLELVSELAAEEVLEHLKRSSPTIAAAAREVFENVGITPVGGGAREIEKRLNHVWSERASSLGPAEWRGPASPPTTSDDEPRSLPLTEAALAAAERLADQRRNPRGRQSPLRRRAPQVPTMRAPSVAEMALGTEPRR